MDDVTNNSQDIDTTFRNGSITAVGVVAGFSLSFMANWSTVSAPWTNLDLIGIVPLAAGVVCQLYTLAALLYPATLNRKRYDRSIRVFLLGLVLVAIGVAAAIGADALRNHG